MQPQPEVDQIHPSALDSTGIIDRASVATLRTVGGTMVLTSLPLPVFT